MLPEVLCVVVYTGRQHWTAPLSLGELTEPGLEARAPWQPELRYLVLDGESPAEHGPGRNRAARPVLRRAGQRSAACCGNLPRVALTEPLLMPCSECW